MSKVLDMTKRRKAQLKAEGEIKVQPTEVVDFEQKKQELVKKERRSHKRTVLTEILGSYIVVPQKGLQEVTVFDLSEDGVSIDVDTDIGQLRVGEELALRIYLSHASYFPLVVKVTNTRLIEDEGVYRHGTHFVKKMVNQEALGHFVKFVEAAGMSLHTDSGDLISSRSRR